ncbi:hypothetical protein [Corynebacterium tapiri]|uniref:Secreted protein n=1 Tax=Corynebacterium tapiri TaxID=1448266 RepID=A0A5C4U711_9CORY|nr:hypothetical protein [Corynebacterium tapiri]TNM00554.1 hypothetical protein FHE74_01005 [Corynebacterium tapiri]
MNRPRFTRRLIVGAVALLSTAMAPAAQAAPVIPAGLSSQYVDELGRPTPELAAKVTAIANLPWMPPEISNALKSGLAFTTGQTKGEGAPLPQNGPHFQQFVWPTVSGGCIGGTGDSVASAIAVPGPASIPAPGAREDQTAFVFTALGTPSAAPNQGQMHVHWINLDTLKFGSTPLHNNGINPEGPATISGTADTGNGTVLAVTTGRINTKERACDFLPTGILFES